jgi:transposase InsO family protein
MAGLALSGDADRCFNGEVIGCSMADHMRTELVTDARIRH